MPRLATLIENRDKLRGDLEVRVAELDAILVDRAWTEEEEGSLTDLTGRVARFDGLIADAEKDETEAKAQQEQRDKMLGAAARGVEGAPAHVNGTGPLTYSEDNPENSFIRDLYMAASPQLQGWEGAKERLHRHQAEMDNIRKSALPSSKEGRATRAYNKEYERFKGSPAYRDVSTGTASMGDFAPPLFFLPEYGPFRTYGRTLVDALKSFPMPDTGMVFNVPVITQPTQAENQTTSTQGAGENTTISTRDMTSAYQSGSLQTIVDNLLVSQQYLDRVGPGVDGDMIARDDQTRQMNRLVNLYGWQALFATPGIGTTNFPVPGSDTSFNAEVSNFRHAIGGAKAKLSTTDGTVAYPTHYFSDPTLWEQVESSYDSQGRLLVVPQGVAFNPMAFGDNTNVPEGYTGYHFASVPSFKDEAMWIQWNGNGSASSGFTNDHPALIADLSIAAIWMEGAPVIRVLPQPYASTLTVLIQQYKYCAFVPIYPAAMQLVFGAGTADSLVSVF